jgi:hypothetical protein
VANHPSLVAKEKVVSAIDGTSHEIKIPSNEPQQKTYFQQTKYFH